MKKILLATNKILKHSFAKYIYNSIDHLSELLRHEDWDITNLALEILYTLVNRINPNMRNTKAHKNQQLCEKLLVLL